MNQANSITVSGQMFSQHINTVARGKHFGRLCQSVAKGRRNRYRKTLLKICELTMRALKSLDSQDEIDLLLSGYSFDDEPEEVEVYPSDEDEDDDCDEWVPPDQRDSVDALAHAIAPVPALDLFP